MSAVPLNYISSPKHNTLLPVFLHLIIVLTSNYDEFVSILFADNLLEKKFREIDFFLGDALKYLHFFNIRSTNWLGTIHLIISCALFQFAQLEIDITISITIISPTIINYY